MSHRYAIPIITWGVFCITENICLSVEGTAKVIEIKHPIMLFYSLCKETNNIL